MDSFAKLFMFDNYNPLSTQMQENWFIKLKCNLHNNGGGYHTAFKNTMVIYISEDSLI